MSSGISIIIPSTGDLRNLKKLIPSILVQDLNGSPLEIIVVLNGVTDSKYASIREFFSANWPAPELLKIEDKGVNKARNAGLQKASQPIVMFLDDDCELHQKNTLRKYVALHEANPHLFAIGGGYILPDEHGLFDEVYNYIQMNWFVCGQKNSSGLLMETQHLLGGNFSLKRDLSVKHSLQFEPTIKYGGSELDYFRKAVKAGLKLAATEMDVTHNTNETFASVGKKVFKQGCGKHFIDAKFGHDDVSSQTTGGRHLVLRRIYSYWFWAGYYGAEGKIWKVFNHLFKDFFGYLNALRFSIIRKVSK
ncbi:MAG: hypothetical protein K0R29_285 [Pseudobdellovibrio sp.]|nr:hypothetical protein [Pseudobdellovibrio sp.]